LSKLRRSSHAVQAATKINKLGMMQRLHVASTEMIKDTAVEFKGAADLIKEGMAQKNKRQYILNGCAAWRNAVIATFRSDHTLIGFIAPPEEEGALTEMQITQIFWNALAWDLLVNCFQYSGPEGDDYEPVALIPAVVNGTFAAVTVLFVIMMLRGVFRWANTRRIKRKKKGKASKLTRLRRELWRRFAPARVKRWAALAKQRRFEVRKKVERVRATAHTFAKTPSPPRVGPFGSDSIQTPPPSPPAGGEFEDGGVTPFPVVLRQDRIRKLRVGSAEAEDGSGKQGPVHDAGTPSPAAAPAPEPAEQVQRPGSRVRTHRVAAASGEGEGGGVDAAPQEVSAAQQAVLGRLAGLSTAGASAKRCSFGAMGGMANAKPSAGALPSSDGDSERPTAAQQDALRRMGFGGLGAAAAGVASEKTAEEREKELLSKMGFGSAPITPKPGGGLAALLAGKGGTGGSMTAMSFAGKLKKKRKELELRSSRVMAARAGVAWSFSFSTLGVTCFYVLIYGASFGNEAATDMMVQWARSFGMAVIILEPLNVLMIATLPFLRLEETCIGRGWNRLMSFYNEFIA